MVVPFALWLDLEFCVEAFGFGDGTSFRDADADADADDGEWPDADADAGEWPFSVAPFMRMERVRARFAGGSAAACDDESFLDFCFDALGLAPITADRFSKWVA